MGAGQSDLYKGTYGDNAGNIPDVLKGRIKMPRNDSQLKHIFREDEGHLPDTPENRKMVSDFAMMFVIMLARINTAMTGI